LITLTSDLEEHYVAQMKAAILSMNPSARILDLSNTIPSFDVRKASFVMMSCMDLLPEGVVNVCVVDPGVGSERKGLIVECEKMFFVGPDNGVFTLPLTKAPPRRIFAIDLSKVEALTGRKISQTFHGRDVFAPVAALLDRGEDPARLGSPLDRIETLDYPAVEKVGDEVRGGIIYIDRFGNVVTNIPAKLLWPPGENVVVRIGGKTFPCTVGRCFSDVRPGSLVALVGSQDTVEISVNMGNASKTVGGREGDPIAIGKGELH